MTDIDTLLRDLEAATKGSRKLDNRIAASMPFPKPVYARGVPGYPPHYTTSLDAALTLVPEGMSADVHIGPRAMLNAATVTKPVKSTDTVGRRVTNWKQFEASPVKDGTATQNTPALALCIAALKARSAA